jgi:hypothetical protein
VTPQNGTYAGNGLRLYSRAQSSSTDIVKTIVSHDLVAVVAIERNGVRLRDRASTGATATTRSGIRRPAALDGQNMCRTAGRRVPRLTEEDWV